MQRDPAPRRGTSSVLWSALLVAGAVIWCAALIAAVLYVVRPALAGTQVQVGYRDHDYGIVPSHPPTAEKPQSKLWWNDGRWWGCLWDPSAGAYRIHRLEAASQDWTSVGPDGDDRGGTLVDCLWNGTTLYIVSQEYNGSAASRLYSYDYDSASSSYSLRNGFPVEVNDEGAESLTIDQDSTGKLWITWESGRDIWVNHSTDSDHAWGTPFQLPVQGNQTSSDDISAVTKFDGNKIGILWSNQSDEAVYFSYHVDGAPDTDWAPREAALFDPGEGQVSDDHLNFSLACDGSGNVYAASKSGLGSGSDPQIYLSRRSPSGTWTSHVVVRKQDDWTRPILLVDHENERLHVFAKSDEIESGAIHVKSANLSDLEFAEGTGTMFIQSDSDVDINDPSSTKQCVDGTTDLLVVASDEGTRHYFHNLMELESGSTDVTIGPGTGRPLTMQTPRPNPRPGTAAAAFDFTLPRAATVTLHLYDVAGRLVASHPPLRFDSAGPHSIAWNPGSLPSGTYFVQLRTGAGASATSSWTVLR